ncbi:TPA: hypothetical protein ACJ3EQ_000944 [Neisseria meningitidis]|uniref:hypothetical protein n=1 Tax=Neisseria meningitidis TaxID=487 RepID=UPI00046E0B07|nr:hypothetical protein [Neisseria meningitidis]MBW3924560.1 hypothetical protein [Neisseria meningitidis]MCG3359321.1 hypothetical protein [Neisseria meningitidis]SPY03324.1 Uncharacterised protein [Neisseria meningitidis]
MEEVKQTIRLPGDSPLNVRYDEESKTISLTCYQFVAGGGGLAMEIQLSQQATQQMLRAVEHLQSKFGVRSEAADMPPNLQ